MIMGSQVKWDIANGFIICHDPCFRRAKVTI
jgi:hypothetical protein